MLWAIVLGCGALAAIFAMTKGQNPLIWFFSSAAGLPLLAMLPPAKGRALAEQKRARRQVGDKLGIVTSAAVVITLAVLGIVGVI